MTIQLSKEEVSAIIKLSARVRGSLGGSEKSKRKAKSSRLNGKKYGGRHPRTHLEKATAHAA
jgi:hypothetical protein